MAVPESPATAAATPGPTATDWRPRCLCIDADGVLHRGRSVLPAATRLLAELGRRQVPFRVVTNNSRELPAQCAAHYRALGLDVPAEAIFTAADAMAGYVRHHARQRRPRVYPFGEPALAVTMRAWGCQVVRARAEFVAMGLNRTLTFQGLARACDLVRAGATLVAANVDATIPSDRGEIPGCGALVAAVEYATGKRAVIVGKPAPDMFRLAVESMGMAPGDALHLGDRIDSDVIGAARAGLRAALVLTGSHRRDDIGRFGTAPDFVFADLEEFLGWYLG